MNTTIMCRDVRPATQNNKGCVVVAYRDVRYGGREIDITDASNLPEVRDRLLAQGIVLGGSLQPASRASTPSSLASPVQIIAHDEYGKEHRLIADHLEEYSLSSGSTLYYLYVSDAACDYRWLVGCTLELAECGSRQPNITEPGTTVDGGRDAGFSEPAASPRGSGK